MARDSKDFALKIVSGLALLAGLFLLIALMAGAARAEGLPERYAEPAVGHLPSAPDGCFAEASGTMNTISAGRIGTYGVGAGCDRAVNSVFGVGASIRAGWSRLDDASDIAAQLRGGIYINPHLYTYALAEFIGPMDGWPSDAQLMLGLGAETTLFHRSMKGFVEASTAAAGIGDAEPLGRINVRAGIRFRFCTWNCAQ